MRTIASGLVLFAIIGIAEAQQRFGSDGRPLSPEELTNALGREADDARDLKAKLAHYFEAIEKGSEPQLGKDAKGEFQRKHFFGRIADAKLFETRQADKPYSAAIYVDMVYEWTKGYPTKETASAAEYSRSVRTVDRSFVVTFYQMKDGSWVPHSLVETFGYMASDKVNSTDHRWRMIKTAQPR